MAEKSARFDEGPSISEFPGAYRTNSKIMALMRDNETWKVAEIYAVRKSKLFEEPFPNDYDFENENVI